jgi:hypothetical protein
MKTVHLKLFINSFIRKANKINRLYIFMKNNYIFQNKTFCDKKGIDSALQQISVIAHSWSAISASAFYLLCYVVS